MPRLSIVGFCLAGMLAAAPAASQSVSADTLAAFVKQRDWLDRPDRPNDWEVTLWKVAQSGRSPEGVIEEFARRTGVSPDAAPGYVHVIVESFVDDEACEQEARRPARCGFSPGLPRYERAASAGVADTSGSLLVAVGHSPLFTWWDQAAFVRLAGTHPAAAKILGAMFDRGRDSAYLMAMLAVGPLTDRVAVMAGTKQRWDLSMSRGDDALREAVLESLERSPATRKASTSLRAALAQWALSSKLALGLIDEAVESYRAYPAEVRALLPLSPAACRTAATDCTQAAGQAYSLGDELAAALWLEGHKGDSRRLLQLHIAEFGQRTPESIQRYRALADAISPVHRREDLFALFIEGHLPGEPPPSGDFFSLSGRGWLFSVRDSGEAVRRVVAGRLRAAGHADMASHLDAYVPLRDWPTKEDPVLAAAASMYPAAVKKRQMFWEERLARVATRGSSAKAGVVRVSTRDLPAWWTERVLPESIDACRETDPPQKPPEGVSVPVDHNAVVRYEERNGERAIVFLSSEYDLAGEIPAYGIWFARTVGGTWTAPLYLGLQQHYPYVVTKGSRLPLLDGQRLRLEVQIREIDSTTITFPPVGLDLKRSADGLYLEFDLDVLASDRDGDGLTDIEERRLGLDCAGSDTDGDGVPDGRDPLPLVRYRAGESAADGLARAIVSTLFAREPRPLVVQPGAAPSLEAAGEPVDAGRARARTRFLVGDPAMFAGLATSFRLILYSQEDLQALTRAGAPFYPARVAAIFSSLDGTRHYVRWSASWTGGAFMVTCATAGVPCTAKEIVSWIS
jgi:hypothetical protein